MTDSYTDLYFGLVLLAVAIAVAALYYISKYLYNRHNPEPEIKRPTPDYGYNPGASIIETNSGFTQGAIAGAVMHHRSRPVHVITNSPTIIEVNPIIPLPLSDDVFYAPIPFDSQSTTQPEPFAGFSGGDSGGGGATSSYDPPVDSCPVDSSPVDNSCTVDNSSSYDAGSSDSNSSSSDY